MIAALKNNKKSQVTYAMPLIYTMGVFSIKLYALLFYRRLFGPNWFMQHMIVAFVWYKVVYTIATILGLALMYNPV
jgi:hypothetical protein